MKKRLFVVFAASLCIIFLISCTGTKSIHKEDLNKTHDLLVVPYRTRPIEIYTIPRGAGIMIGFLGSVLIEAANKGDKEKYAELLNKLRGEWNPSTTIAKECSYLIKNDRKVKINSIEIADIRVLPGTEGEGGNIFLAETFGRSEYRFSPRVKWWDRDSSAIQYKNEYPRIRVDWALEFNTYNTLIQNDTFSFTLAIKMFDIDKGETIAAGYSHGESFTITPIIDEPGFKKFEQEFSSAARLACGRVLGDIGLINFSEK